MGLDRGMLREGSWRARRYNGCGARPASAQAAWGSQFALGPEKCSTGLGRGVSSEEQRAGTLACEATVTVLARRTAVPHSPRSTSQALHCTALHDRPRQGHQARQAMRQAMRHAQQRGAVSGGTWGHRAYWGIEAGVERAAPIAMAKAALGMRGRRADGWRERRSGGARTTAAAR